MQALPAARNRPPGRASHDGIDVGVVPHIEDTGGTRPRGDCKNCNGPKQWIEVTRCNHQSDKRSEDGKHHHAWFHQRDEIRKARRQTGPRRHRQTRQGNRCGLHGQFSQRQRLVFTRSVISSTPLMAAFTARRCTAEIRRRKRRHVCRRYPDESQFDDWECRDLLHAGRAGHRYGFSVLHLGLARPCSLPGTLASTLLP